jgi:plastocyanin
MSVRRAIWLVGLLVALLSADVAAAETRTYRAGPFLMADYNTHFIKQTTRAPAVDGYVTKMDAQLTDSKGRAVTLHDGMLHHVFFNNLDRDRIRGHCSAKQPEVFYGTGEEHQSLDLPDGYGYRVRKGDRWQVSGMLMAHRFRAKRVWITYTVTTTTRPRTEVRPFWVRANGCGSSSSYHVRGGGAPGSLDVRTEHWRIPVSGRIVAAGGHLHAGSKALTMTQPACRGRQLFDNAPFYGPPDDVVYTAMPRLHEAGPVATSWFSSETGIPVRKGETLDVTGVYEAEHARQSVMAITHVYVAVGEPDGDPCAPLPADATQTLPARGMRTSAPYEPIPLWTLDERNAPIYLREPTSAPRALADGARIDLRDNAFTPDNVVITAGSTLNWRFADIQPHNLTFASGPRAVAGQTLARGGRTATTFDTPGRYQLFCYLHPMTMHEQITVLPAS